MLTRELRFRDRAGRETSLRSRRFVSMGRMHLAALEWTLVAENWSGRVQVLSALDGRVLNGGVARYQQLWGRHLDPQGPRIHAPDVIALKARTRQSRIEIAEAARTRVYRGEDELRVERRTRSDGGLHPADAHLRRASRRSRRGWRRWWRCIPRAIVGSKSRC